MGTDGLNLFAVLALALFSGGPVPADLADPAPAAPVAAAETVVVARDQQPAPDQEVADEGEPVVEATPAQQAPATEADDESGTWRVRGTFSPRAGSLLEEMEAALGPIEAVSIWGASAGGSATPKGTSRAMESARPGAEDMDPEGTPDPTGPGPFSAQADGELHQKRAEFSPTARSALQQMERSLVRARPLSAVVVLHDEP